MMKKSPDYKEFMDKKASEAKDAEFKRQGEMLAAIVGGKLEQALQGSAITAQAPPAAFPPAPPQAPVAEGMAKVDLPASVGTSVAEAAVDVSHQSKLSDAQKVIMVAMFGKNSQTDGTFSEIEKFFTKNWTGNPSIIKKMNEFIKDNSTSEVPRPKKERINLFWETLRKLN